MSARAIREAQRPNQEMMEVKIDMVKDLVCGMNVDEKTAKFKSERKSKTYYFCSHACKTAFDENPARYAIK